MFFGTLWASIRFACFRVARRPPHFTVTCKGPGRGGSNPQGFYLNLFVRPGPSVRCRFAHRRLQLLSSESFELTLGCLKMPNHLDLSQLRAGC